jgi:hypothetical protein
MASLFRAPPLHEEPPDIFDVPAAVLCARCGQPDCAGCEDPAELEGSGVASMFVLLVPIVAIALPGLAAAIVSDPVLRARAAFWAIVAVPALSVWMAIAHAAHGFALDVGARRHGGRAQRRRAIRFGLYACGWDLMSGPLGALAAAFSEGSKAAGAALSASMRVPGRATLALLQGVYALSPAHAARARRWGTWAALTVTLVSAFVVLTTAVLIYRW